MTLCAGADSDQPSSCPRMLQYRSGRLFAPQQPSFVDTAEVALFLAPLSLVDQSIKDEGLVPIGYLPLSMANPVLDVFPLVN